MMDENTRPQNTLVAESDLQSSLKAIDTVFSHEKYSQKDENGEIPPIFQQARKSVTTSLQTLVQPVSDQAYYQHVTRNNEVIEDIDLENDNESVQEEEEEFSFEQDELVDEHVLERAQALRNQVRLASQRVEMLRTSVTNRAVSVAQREAALLVGHKVTNDEEPFDAAKIQERLMARTTNNNTSSQLHEMKESLENLSTLLQDMTTQVPETMEMLQETIDVIHETATQQQSQQSLSQTERAIISRSNEGPSQIISQQETNKAPDARLATFLGQH